MNNVAVMTRPNIEIDDYESMMTLSIKNHLHGQCHRWRDDHVTPTEDPTPPTV